MPSGFQTFQSGVAGVAPVTMYQPPDVTEVVMSAVQDIMNRKERTRQFDLQLQKLDQQDRLKQEQFGIQERRYNQQFMIEQQRLRQQDDIANRHWDIEAKHWDQNYEIAKQNSDIKALVADDKYNQAKNMLDFNKQKYGDEMDRLDASITATTKLHDAMSKIPYDQGDPRYLQELNKLQGDPQYGAAFDTKYGKGNQLYTAQLRKHSDDLQARSGREQKMFDTLLKQHGFKSDQYGAYAYDPVENPGGWAVSKDPSTGQTNMGKDGKPRQFWATGPATTQGGKTVTPGVTMDQSDLDNLRDTYASVRTDIISTLRTTMTPQKAKSYLDRAGGDKAKARQMARDDGYQGF